MPRYIRFRMNLRGRHSCAISSWSVRHVIQDVVADQNRTQSEFLECEKKKRQILLWFKILLTLLIIFLFEKERHSNKNTAFAVIFSHWFTGSNKTWFVSERNPPTKAEEKQRKLKPNDGSSSSLLDRWCNTSRSVRAAFSSLSDKSHREHLRNRQTYLYTNDDIEEHWAYKRRN